MAFEQSRFTCKPNIKNRFWVQHSLDEWEARVNDKMAASFAAAFPEYQHVRDDYDDATHPVEDEVEEGMRPADVIHAPDPLDTLEVSWTPIKRGFTAALTDADPLEIDHDEQSLRCVFAKYGKIVKLVARRAAFGEALVVYSTEQEARVAASCANNVAKLTVHLRLPTVDDTVQAAATMEGVERVESRHNKVLHRMAARQFVEATVTRIAVWNRLHAGDMAKRRQEELLKRQEEEKKYGVTVAPTISAEEYRTRAIEEDAASAITSRARPDDRCDNAVSEFSGGKGADEESDKDDVQAEIAREAAKLPAATVLDISAQHLKCGDVCAIALALRKNESVTSLDVRGNEILDDGMNALTELLEWNKAIVELRMDWYSTIRVGMEVEALYPHMDTFGRVRWGDEFVPATVTRVGAGAFDLRFYDGLKFPNVDREQVQSLFRVQDPVTAGEVVLARYDGGPRWFPAKIFQVRQNGKIDVVFLGGEKGAGYKRAWLRNAYQPTNSLVSRVEELVARNVEMKLAADERARLAEIERLLELKRTRWRRRRAKAVAAARAAGQALVRCYGHAVRGMHACHSAAARARARVLPAQHEDSSVGLGAAEPLPLRAGRAVNKDRCYVAAFMDGALGMGVEDVLPAAGDRSSAGAVRVGKLVPAGQAQRAGICVGDHVWGVDGIKLAHPTEDAVARCVSKAARPMTITFFVPVAPSTDDAGAAPPARRVYQSAWARLRHERAMSMWASIRASVFKRRDEDNHRDVASEVKMGVTRWVLSGYRQQRGAPSPPPPQQQTALPDKTGADAWDKTGARQLAPLTPEKQQATQPEAKVPPPQILEVHDI